jgi:uncharacterized protein with FMN-binding domain
LKRVFTVIVAAVGGFFGVTLLHGPNSAAVTTSSRSTKQAKSAASFSKVNPAKKRTGSSVASVTPVSGSAVGKAVNYGYGQIAVRVTVANNKIVDVAVSSVSTLDAYSQQLEQQVVPTLRSEVLKANGTHILLITGATYTSEAYAMSLQDALNQLHFP